MAGRDEESDMEFLRRVWAESNSATAPTSFVSRAREFSSRANGKVQKPCFGRLSPAARRARGGSTFGRTSHITPATNCSSSSRATTPATNSSSSLRASGGMRPKRRSSRSRANGRVQRHVPAVKQFGLGAYGNLSRLKELGHVAGYVLGNQLAAHSPGNETFFS